MTERSGQVFGRYTLVDRLTDHQGVEVFKAKDNRLGSQMLVTLVPVGSDVDFSSRFNNLTAQLEKLEHSNIASLIDHDIQDDIAFLVTNYYPGGTVKGILGQPFLHHDAAHLLAPVAQALDYLHQQGIVHGNIHPANILLDARNQAIVTGIGIAELLEEEKDIIPSCLSGIRNAAYLAPEQWDDSPTFRSDVYALGVVFYELVTGRCPFEAGTPEEIYHKKTEEALPRPKKYASSLPDSVENVIFKVLAKSPENRYRDMSGFSEVLDSMAHTREVQKPLVSTDADTVAATKETGAVVKEYTATTPMVSPEEEIKTTVVENEKDLGGTIQAGSTMAAPPPPSTIKYTPTYAAGMAPAAPAPVPAQPGYQQQPAYAAAPPAKRKISTGLLAAGAAFLFVCLLATAIGGYFFMTGGDGVSEEDYINSMIATGVSLTETAYVTPQSLELDADLQAMQMLSDEQSGSADFPEAERTRVPD